MGCLDPYQSPEQAKPTVIQGEDKALNVQLLDAMNQNAPVDLTNVAEIEAIFLKADGQPLTKTLTGGGVVVSQPLAGRIRVLLSSADTALLALTQADRITRFELRFTIGGKTTIVPLPDSILVQQNLFPSA